MVNLVVLHDFDGLPHQFYTDVLEKMMAHLGVDNFDVAVVLCDKDYIQKLNAQHRGKDVPTDILSFPFFQLKPGERPEIGQDDVADLGDLFLCMEQVVEDAAFLKIDLVPRMHHLLAHGLSHLLGYTHYTEEEHALMEPLEKELIAAACCDTLKQ